MTPLVLLPGMMCDARLFEPQIQALSGNRDLVLGTMTQHDSIEAMARVVLHNAPPSFALAGLSMGGIVAMEVLRQAPGRVERIALLDTNPMAEVDEVKHRRIPQMMAVQNGRLAEIMRDEMKPNYLADSPRRQIVLDLCMEMALGLGPHVFLRQSRALMDRPDQTSTLRSATQHALVLCGREDGLCPVSRHEFMTDLIPNADLRVIDGAGHMPTLEQPETTTTAIMKWLEA